HLYIAQRFLIVLLCRSHASLSNRLQRNRAPIGTSVLLHLRRCHPLHSILNRLNSMQGQSSKCTCKLSTKQIPLALHNTGASFPEPQPGGGRFFSSCLSRASSKAAMRFVIS